MSRLFRSSLFLAALLPAADSAADRIRVTDPELLQAWGYAPDAGYVYRKVYHGPEAVRDADELLGVGSSTEWTSSAGTEFHPITDTVEFAKGPAFLTFNGALISLSVAGIFETQVRMPDGAFWRWLDIAGHHNHTTQNMLVLAIERCLPFFGGGNPSETVLASNDIADQGGAFFSAASINQEIDNAECTYHVRLRMGDVGATHAPASLIQLSKVRAQWTR